MDVGVIHRFHENIIDVFNVAPSKLQWHSKNDIPKADGNELVHEVVSRLDAVWCDEAAIFETGGIKPNIHRSEQRMYPDSEVGVEGRSRD